MSGACAKTKIPLVEGGFATVSPDDYERMIRWRWHQCLICKHVFRVLTGGRTVYMAAEVMGDMRLGVGGG